jgi:hypothetical protein
MLQMLGALLSFTKLCANPALGSAIVTHLPLAGRSTDHGNHLSKQWIAIQYSVPEQYANSTS